MNLPGLLGAGYAVREVRVVDRNGRRVFGVPASAFARATRGGLTSLPRGDLAAALFRALPDNVETIFGDTITSIDQTAEDVRVTFERHGPRTFDLVVGADGLHSRVRELVFGPDHRSERYLGIKVAAFDIEGYRPRDELISVMYSQVGQVVMRFAMRNDRTMLLFTFADSDPAIPSDVSRQKAVLRSRFGKSAWECPRILNALEAANELYFDRVSQIEMGASDGWENKRVALVGDAAFCISLLGGQGAELANGGRVHPRWRTSSDARVSPGRVRAVSAAVWSIRIAEAAGGSAVCRCVCTQVEVLAVPPESALPASLDRLDCRSHGGTRVQRPHYPSRVLMAGVPCAADSVAP